MSRQRWINGFTCVLLFSLLLSGSVSAQQPPSSQDVGLNEGMQDLFAGDFAKAEVTARQGLKASPRSVEALVLLARAQMAQGKYPAAFGSLRKALILSPENLEALYFMGKLTSTLSQLEFQQLAVIAPNSARVHQLKADNYQAIGDLEKAREEYLAALSQQPDLTDPALELAEMLRTQGGFEEALKYYTQILERSPRNSAAAFGAGLCLKGLQQNEKSLQFFELAANLDPGNADSRFALGAAYMQKGDPRKAVEVLAAAVRLDPELIGAYSLLGRALQLTGQPELAAQAFEKARQLLNKGVQSHQEKMKKAMDPGIKK